MAIPDVLDLLRDYLDTQMTEPVATRPPDELPLAWVQLRRVGGTKAPPARDRARIDVIAWAQTEPAAMALALDARLRINNLRGTTAIGVEVYRVEETLGPRQVDDPDTGTPQVWATYLLTFRAEDLVY